MKGQSKLLSLWESIANTLVGYIVTVVFSPLLYWMCDLEISLKQNISLALLFTLLSIARNYVIRRWFNKKTVEIEERSENKPPLGIMPLWLHREQRLEEINKAIDRYNAVGSDIPLKWLVERDELKDLIKQREHDNQRKDS